VPPDEIPAESSSFDQVTIDEDLDKKTEDESALHVRLKCKSLSDIRGDIYRKIKQMDWILLEFHQEAQSLENIFRQLTKEN